MSKIVFMGTPEFAAAPLKALIEAGHEVRCVLTRVDRASGRGHSVHFSPVKETALAAGIPVLQPEKMKDPALRDTLRSYDADLFVTAAYGKILPPEILAIPRLMCVNIHASLLPDYRGAAPIQRALIDGRTETGITTMRMDAGLDTGDILRQYRLPILPDDTGGTLTERLSALAAEAAVDTVRGLEEGSITPVPQGESGTPYAAMLTKEEGDLDWNKSAAELSRLVRGLAPWPGGYSHLDGKLIKFWKTHAGTAADKVPEALRGAAPGTIASDGTGIAVQTGDGILWIDELQPEGKKRMDAAAYLRGAHLRTGAAFQAERS